MTALPLEGIRVLDSTYVFALPYTGGQLADLGAEVIKIEGPGRPDITRGGGLYGTFPDNDPGEDWWNRPSTYQLLNRGKRSMVLDMAQEEGRQIFSELVMVSDVVMENFTPRVMRRWNLDYPNLRKLRPDIIMVSNTGYGHGDGPYSSYPAQATTQEGTHGHCWITGYPGDEPSKAGRSFVDFLSTWSAMLAIGSALRYRNRTGKGLWVDIGMYQAGVMFLSEYLMDAMANGREGERIGNRHPYRAPQGAYPGGRRRRVDHAVRGRQRAVARPVPADGTGRLGIRRTVRHAGRPPAESRRDRRSDRAVDEASRQVRPDARAAGPGHRLRTRAQRQGRAFRPPLPQPQLPGAGGISCRSGTWARASSWAGPTSCRRRRWRCAGRHQTLARTTCRYLEALLGKPAEQVAAWADDTVIAEVPTTGEPSPALDPKELVERRQLAEWDPEYRQRLGI